MPSKSLNEGDRGTEGFGRNRLRSVLVISQAALAVILLIGTGLMLHSFVRLLQVDPGFKPDHLLTMELSLPDARYPNSQKAVKEKGLSSLIECQSQQLRPLQNSHVA